MISPRLNLQQVLNKVYEDAAYELSIDYRDNPPSPKFSKEEREWVDSVI